MIDVPCKWWAFYLKKKNHEFFFSIVGWLINITPKSCMGSCDVKQKIACNMSLIWL